jgi:amidohydrolase
LILGNPENNKKLEIMKYITLILFILTISAQLHAESEIKTAAQADFKYLESLYYHLHRNPELSFHEKNSAERMAKELRKAGFKVTENVGGYGLVGVIKNGPGPVLMIRADMDGLPVEEKTGLGYASKTQVVDDLGKTVNTMHACGHDIHMTVFVGTARRLAEMKDKWSGTLVMIGQPAEERGAGARAMLNDGLYTRFPRPDYAMGLHVNAALPSGQIGYAEGFELANVDSVDITIPGIGGHGAYPHTTKDPIVLAAQIINALQTLVSREIPPIEAGVVTVGSIHGGTKHNIIPDQVDLQLTVRSYSDQTRDTLLAGIKRIAHAQALVMGFPEDKLPLVKVRDEYTPALYNDPPLTRRVTAVLREHLGDERIVEVKPVMGGEDFSQYGRVEPKVPSFFFWLGAVDPVQIKRSQKTGKGLPSLHSAYFAPLPKPTILTGVEAMTAGALDLLNK